MKNDKEIVLCAIKSCESVFSYIGDELKVDVGFIFNIVEENGMRLVHTSKEMRSNIDIVVAAIIYYPYSLKYASINLRTNPKLVSLALMNRVPHVFRLDWRSPILLSYYSIKDNVVWMRLV